MTCKKSLPDLPPIARAEALDRPYRPGQTRRQILVGVALVSALLAVFLAWMSRHAAVNGQRIEAAQDAAPVVVYQNLRAPPRAPPSHSADGDAQQSHQAVNGDSR